MPNIDTLKKRLSRLASDRELGRCFVVSKSDHSPIEVDAYIKNVVPDVSADDQIITVRRFGAEPTADLQLLFSVDGKNTIGLATKEQKDAAVAAALRADS